MSILGIVQLVRYIVAGLDQRSGWTGGFPTGVQITALGVDILGYALFVWATASNAYITQIARRQPERGQIVVSGGPYPYMRHPAYFGTIIYEVSLPILLASWGCLLASGLSVALLILRTAFEDRALKSELTGYRDYSRQVLYRLLPGLWLTV